MASVMRNNKSLRRFFAAFLVLLVVLSNLSPFVGTVAAEEEEEEVGLSAEREKVAEWIFQDKGDNGVFLATGGTYKEASTIQDIGTNKSSYSYDSGENSVRNQGWNDGTGTKYWLATLSTKGFENVTLSSQQTSSSTGPRDYKVQISIDNKQWIDVENGELILGKTDYSIESSKLEDAPLPELANDREILHIRWVINSETNVSGANIGDSGSSRIKDVIVKGDKRENAIIEIPTVDFNKQPKLGSFDVEIDAPVSVKFNKSVELNEGHEVSIIDNDGVTLENVDLEIENNNTLQIKHPNLKYGKTYTVTIPKELVKGSEDGKILAYDVSWSFKTKDPVSYAPTLLNMTFNGDTKTSIAFTWITQSGIDNTVLQVVEASKMASEVFPEEDATTFSGNAEVFNTQLTSGNDSYTDFISHKVIADNLKPGTKYNYRAGDGSEDGWSPVGSFTTQAEDKQDFNFIFASDTQGSGRSNFEMWQDTFAKAIEKVDNPKFLLHGGDFIDNGHLEQEWQWFFGIPQKEFANVPIVPVVGNHDKQRNNDNIFYNYGHHFNLPNDPGTGAEDGTVYSFEYGDALFMVLNTESRYNGEVFANQMEWMRNQVAQTDKKWKFVAMHKAVYATGDNAIQWEPERVKYHKEFLIPVFDELGVDVVFQGHDHMYMRSHQMLNDEVKEVIVDAQGNAIDPEGTVYLLPNTAGTKFYAERPDADDYFAKINVQPNKKMFVDVSVTEDILKLTSYTAVKGQDLEVFDEYSIKRNETKPEKVKNAKLQLDETSATLSWKTPTVDIEEVRGFRVYEANDQMGTNWSLYIPAVEGKVDYNYKLENLDSNKTYDFIIKAVGSRMNSDPVLISEEEHEVITPEKVYQLTNFKTNKLVINKNSVSITLDGQSEIKNGIVFTGDYAEFHGEGFANTTVTIKPGHAGKTVIDFKGTTVSNVIIDGDNVEIKGDDNVTYAE